MALMRRLYRWITTELQLIYEDFNEGYVDSKEDLMDLITIGAITAFLIILFMWFTGTGDTGL
jgi:hypothetical protein